MWFLTKHDSLANVAAQAGYDVWLGNNRGTLYSFHHDKLDPKKDAKEYFDYSFYELGKYDVPTMVDYIREQTGHETISYVAHS